MRVYLIGRDKIWHEAAIHSSLYEMQSNAVLITTVKSQK